jgi:stress response protein YsnF
VVEKSARVVEEVAVRKEATERTETVRDTVRREEVKVSQKDGRPTSVNRCRLRAHRKRHHAAP